MQTIQIKRRVYPLEIDGILYQVKAPNIVEFNDYHDELKKLETAPVKQQDDLSFNLLENLGLPKNIAITLSKDDLAKILGLVVYNVDLDKKESSEKKSV